MTQVRGSRRGARLAGLAGLLGALVSGACSLHQAGVTPPDNRIFFPSGGIVDPDGGWLFVTNSNSDLRYNGGTIVTVDLAKARVDFEDGKTGRWEVCPSDPRYYPAPTAAHTCCRDFLDPTILNCDEQTLIDSEWSVRVGSFAGTPVVQRFVQPNPAYDPDQSDDSVPAFIEPADSARRLFVPVRGDTSITMMNLERGLPMDRPKLFCTGPRRGPNELTAQPAQPPFAACEDEWRITRRDDPLETPNFKNIPDNEILHLPDEPYALAVDDAASLLYVGHLRGFVSLIDVRADQPQVPNLLDRSSNVLPGDANGSIGVTSLTIRDATNTNCRKEIFATSRYRPVASSFVIYGLHGDRCDVTAADADANAGKQDGAESDEGLVIVPTGASYSTGLAGSDTRGIQFVSPDRVFLLQRNPPALVGINTATSSPLSTLEVCQGPSHMAQPTKSDGNTPLFGMPLLFITCFDAGELYIVDPAGPQIRSVIEVGRQPISTVFDANDPTHAYVIGFGNNNVSVVDLDPSSPTHDRVVQRIGFPSATPRDVGPQ